MILTDDYIMPESPECTLMADAIRNIINNKKLKSINILGGKYLKNGQPCLQNLNELSQHLPLTVKSVNIKGKFCWIELDKNWYISITFGMSGGIYYEPTESTLNDYSIQNGKKITKDEYMKHFHILFESTTGDRFYFGDPRRFGNISIANDRIDLDKKLAELGPDMLTGTPISDDAFVKIFRQTKFNNKNICKVLMEQHAVSGVGNYIKAEVLYDCHINPWALISDIDDQTLIKLHHSIRDIVLKAYNAHGTTLYTYSGTQREKGQFQNMLKVYGKDKDPYGNIVTKIPENISPDKRTTHYVHSIQTIGQYRDPNLKPKITIKIKPK